MTESRDRRPAAVLETRDAGKVYRVGRVEHIALHGITVAVPEARTLAVVGESGSGKSTLGRLVAGLERPTRGSVHVDGVESRARAGVVSSVQMVFQSPRDSLNPRLPVGRSIAEPLRGKDADSRVAGLLDSVGLDPARAGERPRAFSGGQLQRVVIARALAADPRVLVCDEATAALDVSSQAQVVNLLMDLQRRNGFACVFITHELALARVVADDVLVLRKGGAVELTPAAEFFAGPREPYSHELLAANHGGDVRSTAGGCGTIRSRTTTIDTPAIGGKSP